MRAQVIADDVDTLLRSLAGDQIFQKGDELCTGVAGAGLADDLAAPGLQGWDRGRAFHGDNIRSRVVPPDRARAAERGPNDPAFLDGTLFVDTEHCGVQRRFESRPMTSAAFLFNFRIVYGDR